MNNTQFTVSRKYTQFRGNIPIKGIGEELNILFVLVDIKEYAENIHFLPSPCT